jgi:hypothetical protein
MQGRNVRLSEQFDTTLYSVVYNEHRLSNLASSGLSGGVLAQVKPIDRTIREVIASPGAPARALFGGRFRVTVCIACGALFLTAVSKTPR